VPLDQLSGKRRIAVRPLAGGPYFDDEVLALDVP
jgi:hypothetical protein